MTSLEFTRQLDSNSEITLELVRNISKEQLNFKPVSAWSILEILEHVYLTDRVVYTLVSRPGAEQHESSEIVGSERLKRLATNRAHKISAPEILQPKGKIKSLEEFEKQFREQRDKLKEALNSGSIKIDNRIHKHPSMGNMTITDWLNFMLSHTERHLEQIRDRLENTQSA